MAITIKKIATTTLVVLLLAAPTPAAARVTVTVEFAYGGVAACGIAFFVYFSQSWEAPLVARSLQGALLEISPDRARWGVPVPSLNPGGLSGEPGPRDALRLDLLSWRF